MLRNDPLNRQKALCEALSQLTIKLDPDIDQLGALLTLDRRTERLYEELLIKYVERDVHSWSLENTIWHSVLELSQAFGQAYDHFLRHIRENTSNKGQLERIPAVLVHLFRHRHIESLCSLFRYEQWMRGRWRELHEAYQFAHSRNLSKRLVHAGHGDGKSGAGSTLEQQYLQILLLQLMNNGQFAPREAFLARQWITRWCKVLSLESAGANGEARTREQGFVVDLGSAEGLKRRPSTDLSDMHLYLDPTPMLVLIDDEMKSLRDSAATASGSASVVRAGRLVLALLAKLKLLFSLTPARIKRRGERTPAVLMMAQVRVGLPCIIRTLRDELQKTAVAPSSSVPDAEETSITDFGGCSGTATVAARNDTPLGSFPNTEIRGLPEPMWRVKDRSESGALLRGRVDDPNRVIPGSLIAFRDCDDAAWTLAVVRRLKKLVHHHVEIGVECIGRNPQGVTMVADCNRDSPANGLMGETRERFAALYLQESAEYPKIPIKTLLLPAREFKFGRGMTLLSTTANYMLRLKEPLKRQSEFVWTAFEVINKGTAEPATSVSTGD